MNEKELIMEMLEFLNEMGQYTAFVNWMGERGYSTDEIESILNNYD